MQVGSVDVRDDSTTDLLCDLGQAGASLCLLADMLKEIGFVTP